MSSPEFVALADLLRGQSDPPRPSTDTDGEEADIEMSAQSADGEHRTRGATIDVAHPSDDLAQALCAARLFRARLADAFDAALARLLRELAADVLVRELRLAPCDLAALARRLARDVPFVRLRLAPEDAGCGAGLPEIADAALCPGDAIVELAGGELDARLGVRLADVLERAA